MRENVSGGAKLDVSVIICAHNPDLGRLAKVMALVREQTLAQSQWELLVIDNGSNPALAGKIDVSWHRAGRIIREDKLGLTWARVRGIRESSSDLVVFVDDDNLLAPDYLAEALKVAQQWPMIGAWGGEVALEFETPPADWTRAYWWMLGSRSFERDAWSNNYDSRCLPCGAGMCVRKSVAAEYARLVANEPARQALDRRGSSLSSSGDTDIAWTACDMGFGVGQTVRLKLRHLIPPTRLTRPYFLRLLEGMAFSDEVLKAIRFKQSSTPETLFQKMRQIPRFIRMSSFDKKMFLSEKAGRKKAQEFLREISVAANRSGSE